MCASALSVRYVSVSGPTSGPSSGVQVVVARQQEVPSMGPFVRRLRVEAKLTQSGLGQLLDPPMAQSEVSAIEHGRIKLPPLARVRQLAEALGVTPYDFLEQSGWTGAALAYQDEELSPEVSAITGRYRRELLEVLPRLAGSDIRALAQIAKRLAAASAP